MNTISADEYEYSSKTRQNYNPSSGPTNHRTWHFPSGKDPKVPNSFLCKSHLVLEAYRTSGNLPSQHSQCFDLRSVKFGLHLVYSGHVGRYWSKDLYSTTFTPSLSFMLKTFKDQYLQKAPTYLVDTSNVDNRPRFLPWNTITAMTLRSSSRTCHFNVNVYGQRFIF